MTNTRRLDVPAVRALANEVAGLYRACYTGPPWYETSEQVAKYPNHTS